MKDIEELSDDVSHLEKRRMWTKDHEEHSLTTDERDKIIREYNVEHSVREIDPEEVRRLYYDEKLSQRKVGEALGVPRWVIQGIFKEQEWEPRTVGAVEKDIDPQEVYRLCVEAGCPKNEAAEILGCKSTKPITRILKENEWKTPLEVKMETEIDPEDVHRLHYDEGWSLKRIANHYGYKSKGIIQRLFREREWIPTGLTRQGSHEPPSENELEDQFEPSSIYDAYERSTEKNIGLPDFIMHGSSEIVMAYFRNGWSKSGCFTIEYPRKIPYFVWEHTVTIRHPPKESMFADEYLPFFEKYGERIRSDLKNGFKEEIQLNATTLDECIRTENAYIDSPAKRLGETVLSNQSRLLNDEIVLLRRTAVRANKKLMKLTYHLESGLVSITRRGQIYRKKDIKFIRDVVFSEVQERKGRGA